VVLAAAHGQLGRTAEAQSMAETVKRNLPVFDPQTFGSRFQNRSTTSISSTACGRLA
jgi:adenylate cyclase